MALPRSSLALSSSSLAFRSHRPSCSFFARWGDSASVMCAGGGGIPAGDPAFAAGSAATPAATAVWTALAGGRSASNSRASVDFDFALAVSCARRASMKLARSSFVNTSASAMLVRAFCDGSGILSIVMSDMLHPELWRPELKRPELRRPELRRPELYRPEMLRPERCAESGSSASNATAGLIELLRVGMRPSSNPETGHRISRDTATTWADLTFGSITVGSVATWVDVALGNWPGSTFGSTSAMAIRVQSHSSAISSNSRPSWSNRARTRRASASKRPRCLTLIIHAISSSTSIATGDPSTARISSTCRYAQPISTSQGWLMLSRSPTICTPLPFRWSAIIAPSRSARVSNTPLPRTRTTRRLPLTKSAT
mmetsp:Transcript_30169/g.69955  ORF Transcript_30169/g.69955 Transcript_30169/m.69955 type:complete len:371 (-) Transcript_30169:982-2094(-)